jgi:predicted methyltransferase
MVFSRAGASAVALFLLTVGPSLAHGPEAERITSALDLKPGLHVADVGAGDGEWTEVLARSVGPGGHVYATEVDEAELEKVRRRASDARLENVTTLLGTQDESGLAESCCDAILLRLVYHHFTAPARMRQSLRRALRPGARLAVVDIDPQKSWRALPGVPERGGHGIAERDLVAEMTADGFEVAARYPEWNGDHDRYCVVFRPARQP